jgi:hypothetical protein
MVPFCCHSAALPIEKLADTLKIGPYPDTIGADFRPKHTLNIAAWHAARATSQDTLTGRQSARCYAGAWLTFFAGDQNRSSRIENLIFNA